MAKTRKTQMNQAELNHLPAILSSIVLGDYLLALCETASHGTNLESPTVTSNAVVLSATAALNDAPEVQVIAATGAQGVYPMVVGAPSAGQAQLDPADQVTINFNSADVVTAVVVRYVPAGGALDIAATSLLGPQAS